MAELAQLVWGHAARVATAIGFAAFDGGGFIAGFEGFEGAWFGIAIREVLSGLEHVQTVWSGQSFSRGLSEDINSEMVLTWPKQIIATLALVRSMLRTRAG